MILRFCSGSSTPFERREKTVLGIDADDMHPHVLGKGRHHLVTLAVAQQAVVDEHADQLVADGLVQQRGHHRGIDAAGQAQQHLAVADLGTDIADTARRRCDPAVHRASQPHISITKRCRMRPPWRVWVTSGWNWMP